MGGLSKPQSLGGEGLGELEEVDSDVTEPSSESDVPPPNLRRDRRGDGQGL